MTWGTLERAVLYNAKDVFKNKNLRLKDLMEWSTGQLEPHDGEVIAFIPNLKVWVAIKKELDKR
jgi:hypothetical protein